MSKRFMIPNSPESKVTGLTEIVQTLLEQEIYEKAPSFSHISDKISHWETGRFSGNDFPIRNNTMDIRMTKADIVEALAYSAFSNQGDPLKSFITDRILRTVEFSHDILSRTPEYRGTAARRIDRYVANGNLKEITSKANARNYLALLKPTDISDFLQATNSSSVVTYLQQSRKNITHNGEKIYGGRK